MRIQYKCSFNVSQAVCLSSFQIKGYLNLRIEIDVSGYIYIYVCVNYFMYFGPNLNAMVFLFYILNLP